VTVLIGKLNHLVFESMGNSEADAGNLPGVKRRLVQVAPDRLMNLIDHVSPFLVIQQLEMTERRVCYQCELSQPARVAALLRANLPAVGLAIAHRIEGKVVKFPR